MYLQLAENSTANDNPYIFIPDVTGRTRGIRVREDLFDDLTDAEYNEMMRDLAPFQRAVQQGLSENYFLSDRASRRQKRKERQEEKQKKKELKNQKREAKNEIKRARAEAKKSGQGGRVLDSVMGVIGGVVGKKFGGGEEEVVEYEDESSDPNLTPWYQRPSGMIGIGIGTLAVAAALYAAFKKSN